ncbi:MAG: creatininase family protein [Candidatus Latescibacteria bacterium]|jgi:creatinine amidohydrolase|nr:creatininase family protein [Candidatus Latescibacterota bacterium]
MSVKFDYAEMIWYEIKEAIDEERVALLPVATYEDHGPHLPVDVDVVLCNEICRRAAAQIPDEVVLIPPVNHGYSPHHMDFHGTITIRWDTFINYVKDVCCSLAYHGFKRILIINGHGSNTSPLDMAARLSIIEYEGKILCASANHWGLYKTKELGKDLRDSDYGGTSHAGEFETALYLALKPDLVDMSKAVDERSPLSASFKTDLLAGGHPDGADARLVPYWSSVTASGVMGDATKATREKGEKFLEAGISGVVDLVRELRETPVLPRRDQHDHR